MAGSFTWSFRGGAFVTASDRARMDGDHTYATLDEPTREVVLYLFDECLGTFSETSTPPDPAHCSWCRMRQTVLLLFAALDEAEQTVETLAMECAQTSGRLDEAEKALRGLVARLDGSSRGQGPPAIYRSDPEVAVAREALARIGGADLFSWLRGLETGWSCKACGYKKSNKGWYCDLGCGRDYNRMTEVAVVPARLWPLALDVIEAAKLQGEAEPPDLGEADEALAHAVAAFLAAAEKEMGS